VSDVVTGYVSHVVAWVLDHLQHEVIVIIIVVITSKKVRNIVIVIVIVIITSRRSGTSEVASSRFVMA
jgi:hypothetical protein